MQARRRAATQGPKGDINVTPLVDVVLVMLIIFMVVTPMLQKGANVELPVTRNPDQEKSLDEQVTISVDREGRLFWETEPIDEPTLSTRMGELYAKPGGASTPVFIKGDAKARYFQIRRVMKLINEAGFEQVGVITKEEEKSDAA